MYNMCVYVYTINSKWFQPLFDDFVINQTIVKREFIETHIKTYWPIKPL